MSRNIINTKLHHTFRFNPPKYTDENLPIKSEIKEKSGKRISPFLGEGYYFWDNNIEMARFWGEHHYAGEYRILEVDTELKGDHFLDLVGSREDLYIFSAIVKRLNINPKSMPLGAIIDYLRQINTRIEVFPYRIIRALELQQIRHGDMKSHNDFLKYGAGHKVYMNINPLVIVAYSEKSDIINIENGIFLQS